MQQFDKKLGGALAFAMGRVWGEGDKYWAGRFEEINEAASQLRVVVAELLARPEVAARGGSSHD